MEQPTVVQQPVVMQQAPPTMVIVQQPGPALGVISQEREWGTGLFGCFEDFPSCLAVLFCGPCYTCQMSSKMGEGCCMPCCVPYALAAMRLKMRTQHNIRGSIMNDCCVVQFLGPCALCQIARELKKVSPTP